MKVMLGKKLLAKGWEKYMTITDWRVLAVLLGFILALILITTGKVDDLITLVREIGPWFRHP